MGQVIPSSGLGPHSGYNHLFKMLASFLIRLLQLQLVHKLLYIILSVQLRHSSGQHEHKQVNKLVPLLPQIVIS